MNSFNNLIKPALPFLALFFVACSPQKKVQQYSYLLKHKSSAQLIASVDSKTEPNLRPPISSTERKIIPASATSFSKNTSNIASTSTATTTTTPTTTPIAKTEVKATIEVSSIEAPKESISAVETLDLKISDREKVIKTAAKFLGAPYKYAGTNKEGIDCSGLICQAYNAANIVLPRTSWAMAQSGKVIPITEVAPGHLLFFHSYKGKGVNHVALVSKVTGEEIEFIHATVSNGVRKDKLSDPYWNERFRMAVIPRDKKK